MLSPNEAEVSAPLCAEDVERVLRMSAWSMIRGLRAAVHDGVVTLTGYVQSFYYKQVAYQEVRCVTGVTRVKDLVEVYYG